MAFNLTRAIGALPCPVFHAKATAGTIRAQPINVPGRLARSARKLILRLRTDWPWETAWEQMAPRARRPSPPLLTHAPRCPAQDRPDQNVETNRPARSDQHVPLRVNDAIAAVCGLSATTRQNASNGRGATGGGLELAPRPAPVGLTRTSVAGQSNDRRRWSPVTAA